MVLSHSTTAQRHAQALIYTQNQCHSRDFHLRRYMPVAHPAAPRPWVIPAQRIPLVPRPLPSNWPHIPSLHTRAYAAHADVPQQHARICVLGAGVVGLTTALRLLQRFPGAQVTVYADKFGRDTTTAGAAGVWQPYKLSETPTELVDRWGQETFDHLLQLYHSDQAVAAGVSMSYCNSLYLEPEPDPFYKDTVFGFRRMSQQELKLYSSTVDWGSIREAAAAAAAASEAANRSSASSSSSSSSSSRNGAADTAASVSSSSGDDVIPGLHATAFVDGYSFNTVVCEGRLYMQWLISGIKAAGGQLQQRTVNSLTELSGEGWDAVVNCCGLRSKDLMLDPYCYPIRGQITKVRAPWVTQCVFAHFPGETAYIIPNREWVVLGGTGQVGNWDTNTSLADADQILERCSQLLPALKEAEVVDQWVGLRPGRVRLRLEVTPVTLPVTGFPVDSHPQSSNVSPAAGTSTSGAGSSRGGGGGGEGSAAAGVPGAAGDVGSMVVVSNYGHGGSGLTLSWGTAGDAVELVAAQLAAAGRVEQHQHC